MRRIGKALRASTMVETLVMMIVAGIVFLTVTEGLGMFMRLQTRRIVLMERSGRLREGVFRLEALAGDADSVEFMGMSVVVHRNGAEAMLTLSDSALVYRRGGFADTLLTGVGLMRLEEYGYAPDTLEVTIRSRDRALAVRLGIRRNLRAEYEDGIRSVESD